MAFSTLSDTLIQVGKAIKREIFTTLKDNQDDLNTRLTTVEGTANKVVIFDGLVRNASSAATMTGLTMYRVASSYTLLDCKVGIFEKGSLTGTLEIDVRLASSPDDTGASSVFTTQPSINFATASNYDESTNAVFDGANKDVVEGDYLIFDVTSMPTGGTLGKFVIYLIGEAS